MHKIVQYEQKITYVLSRVLDQCRHEIIHTTIQYTQGIKAPVKAQTFEQCVRNVITLNNLMVQELNEQVLQTAPESVREVIGAIADQICQYNRRISLVLVTATTA